MGLSNELDGKRNAMEVSGGGSEVFSGQSHAPMFARPGEPEPNAVAGERLQPSQPRGKPEPTRTRADAHAKGLGAPEALDARGDEVDS